MNLKRAKQVIRAHGEAKRLLAEHQRAGTVDTIRAANIRLEGLERELGTAHAVVADYEARKQSKANRIAAHARVVERAKLMGVPGNLERFADAVVSAASDAEIEALLGRIARVDATLIVPGEGVEERVRAALTEHAAMRRVRANAESLLLVPKLIAQARTQRNVPESMSQQDRKVKRKWR